MREAYKPDSVLKG